jgi:SSS family solute:Na+ symporter
MGASAIASVLGSLWTKPDDEATLVNFYKQVRPWGFWEPVYQKVIIDNPEFRKNTQAARDLSNVFVGVVWQTSLRLIPLFLVVYEFTSLWVAIGLSIVTTWFLKINWYDKLEEN